MRRRLVLLVAAGYLVAAVLSGCGSSSARVAVPDEQKASHAVRFELTEKSDNDAVGWSQREFGVFDFVRRAGLIHGNDALLGGEIRVVDDVTYLSSEAAAGEMVDRDDPCFGKPWFFMEKSDEPDRVVSATAAAEFPIDPVDAIDTLEARGASFVEVGRESVRGVEATRSRLDLASVAGDSWFVPDDDPASESTLVAFEAWVDRERRLARVRWSTRITDSSEDELPPFVQTTTLEFWDYGVEVDVEKPLARDTCDFAGLFDRTMRTFR